MKHFQGMLLILSAYEAVRFFTTGLSKMQHAVDEQAIVCPVPETTMQKVETTSSNEVVSLQSRILSLELLVCELLTKNERLRIANSELAHGSPLDRKRDSLNLLSPGSSVALS